MNKQVANFMSLAHDCLDQARWLLEAKFYRGTCTQAYYAYFNGIRALLATKELITKSHSAARGLFSEHFIKNGPFTKKDSSQLNQLFELRQSSTYDPDEETSETDALMSIELASEFLLQIDFYLHGNGFAQ